MSVRSSVSRPEDAFQLVAETSRIGEQPRVGSLRRARSTYRHNAFASRICCGVRQFGSEHSRV